MKNLLLTLVLILSLVSCKKEYSNLQSLPSNSEKEIIKDDFVPPGGFNFTKRKFTPELFTASANASRTIGKGRNKPPKDTTTYNPPPSTEGDDYVIFYDFDGGYVNGTSWNVTGPITLAPSGMTSTEITTAMNLMIRDYAEYNILITADSAEYFKRPKGKRMRIYVTTSWEWYGRAGGVAYVNSMFWTNDTPAFVFSSQLGYSGKYIVESGSHEGGHTLGLRHQCDWKDGVKQNEYSQGITPDKAPTMGVGYYDNDTEGSEFVPKIPTVSGTWQILNSYGSYQDDHQIILNKVGPKK
jgi:hypothetical protein